MNAGPPRRAKHESTARHHLCHGTRRSTGPIALPILVIACLLSCAIPWGRAQDSATGPEFTDTFDMEPCGFSTIGTNPYFILLPGYQLVLEGQEDDEALRVEITVLHEIETMHLDDLGTVRTRVVEEREWADSELLEVSRNFYAICCRTNAVYYFGEDVDIYEDGEVISHDGAWRAGANGARPGVMMPGTFLLGSRYYQEIAPEVALDRAEHVAMRLTIETVAGAFADCVQVLETTPLDPEEAGSKFYCPGVGLVVDEELELVAYGFNIMSVSD